MPGLPPAVLRKLKQTLAECGPFSDDRRLAALFNADERIALWRFQIPQAYYVQERIDLFIGHFLNVNNHLGQSVLVLFLQAVYDQATENDQCLQRLTDVAIEVAVAKGDKLPPLARDNLVRAYAVSSGEVLPDNIGGYRISYSEPGSVFQHAGAPAALDTSIFGERLESLKSRERADWLPIRFLEEGLYAARAVGRVEYHGRKIGTGFLVASDLLLTNEHVVLEIPVFEEGGVRFNAGLQGDAHWCYFAEQVLHSPVKELDFCLVRLKTALPGVRPVILSNKSPFPQQAANILQYPNGQDMQVALRRNEIVYVDSDRLYYVADTEKGSSGSPVFDDDWRVIGMHQAGIFDRAERPVKNANQGIPMSAINPHISSYIRGG